MHTRLFIAVPVHRSARDGTSSPRLSSASVDSTRGSSTVSFRRMTGGRRGNRARAGIDGAEVDALSGASQFDGRCGGGEAIIHVH